VNVEAVMQAFLTLAAAHLVIGLVAFVVVCAVVDRWWRWLTRPRRIVTKARLYKWPDAKRRER